MTDLTGQALRDAMATEVMGWHKGGSCNHWRNDRELCQSDWLPDTDPRCWAAVLDRMTALGWSYTEGHAPGGKFACAFWQSSAPDSLASHAEHGLAICHAALAAVRGSK